MRCPPLIAFTVVIALCAAPSVAQDSADPDAQSWSRAHAVQALVEGNADIQRTRFALREHLSQAESTAGLFDTTLGAELNLRRSVTPVDTAFAQGSSRDEAYGLRLSVSRRFIPGTTILVSLDQNIQRSESTIRFQGFEQTDVRGPNVLTGLSLTVDQPLLQGFGRDINLLPRRIAEAQMDVDLLTMVQSASQRTVELLTAYAELSYAVREAESQEIIRERAERQFEIAEAQVDAGLIAPFELDLVRDRILRSEEAIIVADGLIGARSIDLANLIGAPPGAGTRIQPSDGPVRPIDSLSVSMLCDDAAAYSPDLAVLREQALVAGYQIEQAEDDLRPSLNVSAGLTFAGLDSGYFASYGQVFTLDSPTIFAGLVFSMPLGNEVAEGQLEQSEIAVERAEFEIAELERQLCFQVEQIVTQIDALRDREELAEQRITLAQGAVEAEEQRFAAGESTVQQGLDALDQLESASLALIRVQTDLENAWWQLAHLTGAIADEFLLMEQVSENPP